MVCVYPFFIAGCDKAQDIVMCNLGCSVVLLSCLINFCCVDDACLQCGEGLLSCLINFLCVYVVLLMVVCSV